MLVGVGVVLDVVLDVGGGIVVVVVDIMNTF